jgi:hypothetical protein
MVMQRFLLGVGVLRAPIAVVIASAILLIGPPQSHEIFQTLVDADRGSFAGEIVRGGVPFAIFLATLLATSLISLNAHNSYRETAVSRHRRFLEAMAYVLPMVVVLSVLIALADNSHTLHVPFISDRAVSWKVIIGAAVPIIVASAVLVLMKFDSNRRCWTEGIVAAVRPLSDSGVRMGLAAMAAFIAAICAAVVVYPHYIANLLGPLGVLFLFLSVLCVTSSLLAYVYDHYQIPAISLLGIAAIAWAYIPTNNNHQISITTNKAKDPPQVAPAFKEWLVNRPDRADYKGRPYPVYVVTTEGGGLYAGAHAAWTLAVIQDSCPAFAPHVFAVSGVSGGSLGAALFSALLKAYPPMPGETAEARCPAQRSSNVQLQEAVREFFSEDFLTPLLAAGLFPDFFQRFWPLPIGVFDRARSLEASFEQAWKRIAPPDNPGLGVFRESLRDLWAADANRPALLLNATIVQNGERAIIAPFRLREVKYRSFVDRFVDLLNENYAVPLATAVGVSARFPLVTPPALHWHEEWRLAAQLVDGGYYDNSGIFTVMNLVDLLRRTYPDVPPSQARGDCSQSNVVVVPDGTDAAIVACIKIITIRGKLSAPATFAGGEMLAPFAALYESRIAKGIANLAMSYNVYCGGDRCGLGSAAVRPHIYVKYLDVHEMGLPLGWYFSTATLRKIFVTSSSGTGCFAGAPPPLGPRNQAAEEENACLYPRIANDLNGPR